MSIEKSVVKKFISLIDGDNKVVIADKLLDKNVISVFKDEELMASANAFFDNNLNISETSRNTFMHRNTLIYRIEKIKKISGLDIRLLNDAVTFMLLQALFSNTKNVR